MKKHNFTDILTPGFLLFSFYGFLRYASPVREAVGESLGLVSRVLIPSLFPAMVISSLFIASGAAFRLGKRAEKLMRLLFDLPGEAASPLLLGLIGGYPIGAKSTLSLYASGGLTSDEAERLLFFSNNAGPAFLLLSVGLTLYSSWEVGFLLFFSHLLAAFTLAFLSRLIPHPRSHEKRNVPSAPSPSFSAAFTSSVASSALSLLNLAAFVVFFSAVICVLRECGLLPRAAMILSRLSGLSRETAKGLLSGLIEMTGGLTRISALNSGLSEKLILSSFLLGWAGLSVHFQALSFQGEKPVSFRFYFIGKFLHGLLSAFYTFLFTRLFPVSVPAAVIFPLSFPSFPSPGTFLLFSLLCSLVFIFPLFSEKKL